MHKFERKTNRLNGYDYSQFGYYFITICAKGKFFGDVRQDGVMELSNIGNIAKECWQNIPEHFKDAVLDEYVVMPNHIHGIIFINTEPKPNIFNNMADADPRAVGNVMNADRTVGNVVNADLRSLHSNEVINDRTKMLLPKIIHGFKSSVTRIINRKNNNVKFLWQKSYYDHIIRNENALKKIQKYIISNPFNWRNDVENPECPKDISAEEYYKKLFESNLS